MKAPSLARREIGDGTREVDGYARSAMSPPSADPIAATDEQLEAVAWNADGLVPAIVQEAGTGRVLMLAWVNEESLRRTLAEGRTVFWSRSRGELWRKGDTSGDRQWLREAYYDCDGDTLLFVVEQEGRGACHTGERSCFFRAFGESRDAPPGSQPPDPR
jgi:phosphoribosyl-AMP cyclohydrolase